MHLSVVVTRMRDIFDNSFSIIFIRFFKENHTFTSKTLVYFSRLILVEKKVKITFFF